ncbi:hypothetical protein Tco_1467977 [Tanacetum coccineum]
MENLLSCDPDVLSEVLYSDSYPNDMINQDVQEMQYSEQTHIDNFQDNEIHSDSNIIPYSQYLQESQDAGIEDTNSSVPNDLLVLSLVEQMTDHVAHLDKENKTNKMLNESLTAELERYKERKIDTLKETLSNHVKEKESLSKTLSIFKTESKEKESKYIDKEIVLEKQNKELKNIISLGYQNPFNLKKAQRIQPTLYDGSVIAKEHAVISVIDDEETLILEEERRSKMLDKQNDPISIEKKIKISPIDYSKLNKIKEDFGKHFVTQKELFAKQASWLKHLSFSKTPVTSHTPVKIEAPSELAKISLVNESLKKLKYQLANFDKVVKKRPTSDAITAGAWGFEHTKAYEITEVQTVFNQMEAVVDQCSVEKNIFEIQIKQFSIDNDQLLKQIMSQEIVHIAVNSVDILDVKNYSTLEKHCISLELTTQLNQEVFQNDNFRKNQYAPTFNQLIKLNELKAQSQEKDTVIRKLKDKIKSFSGKDSVENVKKYIDEIETINCTHASPASSWPPHCARTVERSPLSWSITRVQSKEYCDSLIAQMNAKSVENSFLNAQLQEKVFAIAALKNKLRKHEGKNVIDTVVSKPSATIAPGMLKLDTEPISHRLKNNRDAHEVYIEKPIENTDTLRGFVERTRTQNPSEPLLESACMFTKHV